MLSLETSLDAILARCIFDNSLTSSESSVFDSPIGLVKLYYSLNDLHMVIADQFLFPRAQYANSGQVDGPEYEKVEVISPFSSVSDTDTYSEDESYLTSEWDSVYSELKDCVITQGTDKFQPPNHLKTELAMKWDNSLISPDRPIISELHLQWYGYPFARPATPDEYCGGDDRRQSDGDIVQVDSLGSTGMLLNAEEC